VAQSIDGVLVEWGERLFYPANRRVQAPPTPRLDTRLRRQAAVIRARIETTVSRRTVQVMVKVTGGGRGMAAIAAHFRYISKSGRLDIEDDRGNVQRGKEALHDLIEQWRYGGTAIDEVGHRREAFNIMLSMPNGTSPALVQAAARDFAREELLGHRYVMVLHNHQANPHVHLSVKASSMLGDRLNPRKADLHRWRETFAEKLRGYGIEAEASRQATRGVMRNFDPIWRVKTGDEGRLRETKKHDKTGQRARLSRSEAAQAWSRIAEALASSDLSEDRHLAAEIRGFIRQQPSVQEVMRQRQRDSARQPEPSRHRDSPPGRTVPGRRLSDEGAFMDPRGPSVLGRGTPQGAVAVAVTVAVTVVRRRPQDCAPAARSGCRCTAGPLGKAAMRC